MRYRHFTAALLAAALWMVTGCGSSGPALTDQSAAGTSRQAGTTVLPPGADIQAAINAAAAGDTLALSPGTYQPPATIVVNKPLTIKAADASAKPLIDGRGALDRIILVAADNVVLEGLEVAYGTGDLIRQDNTFTGTTVRGCVIHDATGDEAVQLQNAVGAVIECCVAYNIAEDGFNLAYSRDSAIRNCEVIDSRSQNGAIYVYNSVNIEIAGNSVHDCSAANGIELYTNDGDILIRNNRVVDNAWVRRGSHAAYSSNAILCYKGTAAAATITIAHNTIANNRDSLNAQNYGNGIGLNTIAAYDSLVNIRDNIIAFNGGWAVAAKLYYNSLPTPAKVTITSNDIHANANGAFLGTFTVGANLDVDPLFDAGYGLAPGSPCRGAASDGSDLGALAVLDCPPPVLTVAIDIKPGSDPNSINLKSNGNVPVAILTTPDFDATTVDVSSVIFAGAHALRANREDVDGDGDLDIVLHFDTRELQLDASSTSATLTGMVTSGGAITGTDAVRIVPAAAGNGPKK